MERKYKTALNRVEQKDFAGALIQLHIIYNSFYLKKHEITTRNANKNFKQIAKSDCNYYKVWREEYLEIDSKSSTLLKVVEAYSYKNNREFINFAGVDLLKKTNAMRNHCMHFANLRYS